jgi:hypothetical protein
MLREKMRAEDSTGNSFPQTLKVKQSLEEKNMEPSISVVTAMLYSVAYNNAEYGAPVVPEADFVPFNLSHLRDFPDEFEQSRNSFGGRAQNVPEPLPA